MQNVWILTLAQAFAGCGTIMLVSFAGIAGTRLAPAAALATLPVSLSILGLAASSLPAALLMQRIGRRRAFIGSACAAALAALLCARSIAVGSFVGLCLAGALNGASMSFVQQYRFAATEYLPPGEASRGVSTVMLGTLAAAILGPLLGTLARNLGGWQEFTGSFVVLSGLCLTAAAILTRLGPPPAAVGAAHAAAPGSGRPLAAIARQPAYRLAVLSGLASYAVMSFIMTATPISMHVHDHFDGPATTSVISAHLLGMYLPSLATPLIVRVLGVRTMLWLGCAINAVCIAIDAFAGHAWLHYFTALSLLGLGWNLMFVAATTLLTGTYTAAERFRAQGLNDLLVFGSQACASLLAGIAIENLGWERLNLASLPLLAAVVLLLWHQRPRARATEAAA